MDKQEWADKEVQLFCNEFKKNDDKDEYIRACIEAAILSLTVYSVILKDEKTDSSLVLSIVEQLSKGLPLTPIMNREDDWELLHVGNSVVDDDVWESTYRCTRYSKLYRVIKGHRIGEIWGDDRKTTYFEKGRVRAYDMNHPEGFTGKLFDNIADEVYPITFPYMPVGEYKIFCDRFFSGERKEGDTKPYNTMSVRSITNPNGERKDILKYFKMDSPVESGAITAKEYLIREKTREVISNDRDRF